MKRLSVVLLAAGCLAVTATLSQATEVAARRTNLCGVSIVWCVWVNYNTRPYTIGVANGIYGRSHPGWYKLAGVYAKGWQAWRTACRYHRLRAYHSPDIAARRVNCRALLNRRR